jgi:hypothetical protein
MNIVHRRRYAFKYAEETACLKTCRYNISILEVLGPVHGYECKLPLIK